MFYNCDSLTSLDLSTFNVPSGLGGLNYIGGTTVNALKQITLSASLIQYVDTGLSSLWNKSWYRIDDNTVYLGNNGVAITEPGTYYDAPHAHSFSTAWLSDGTNHWHECTTCGTVQPNSTDAHTAGAAATCTTAQTCTVCSYEIAPKLEHIFDNAPWQSNPTNHWHNCTRSGCTGTDTATAHTFRWVVDTPATVTTPGVQHEECPACGFAKSQGTVIPIVTCNHPNTTHNAAVAATCVATGNVEYWHCNDCGKDLDASSAVITNTSTAIDPNNHSFTSYVYNNNATCTLDGTETATCDRNCGATDTRTKTGTMLNHDFNNAPWSTGTSNHWHVCTRTDCDVTDTPAPHTFQWVIDTAATVTSTGIRHEECTVCGYTQSQGTVIPVLSCAHNNKTHYPAVAANCMQQGNVEYWYCSDCLKNVDQAGLELTTVTTPIDPTNHSYTTYLSNNNATCTQNGTKTAECDFGCGTTDTVEDEGSATGHTHGEEATCTETQTCTVCNTEIAPALGHDWSTEWSKDETNHWHICSRCDELNDETAHTYEWVITQEATVEQSGLMENLCTVCGDKDGEEEIAKLIDPNGEIDLPVDINVEFKVTQSSTDNDYSDIDKGLK
ncbi:MAG: hypothetical protein K2O67_04115, partial [Clostridia bacterium]|nr:hypothetical protein [Clostridia bacterium]